MTSNMRCLYNTVCHSKPVALCTVVNTTAPSSFEPLKRRRISERNDEFDASNPLQSCSICKGFEIHVPSASRFCIYASNANAFRASRVCMHMHSAMRPTARR